MASHYTLTVPLPAPCNYTISKKTFILSVSKCLTSACVRGWENRRGYFTIKFLTTPTSLSSSGIVFMIWRRLLELKAFPVPLLPQNRFECSYMTGVTSYCTREGFPFFCEVDSRSINEALKGRIMHLLETQKHSSCESFEICIYEWDFAEVFCSSVTSPRYGWYVWFIHVLITRICGYTFL